MTKNAMFALAVWLPEAEWRQQADASRGKAEGGRRQYEIAVAR